jgi:hypothetical protein
VGVTGGFFEANEVHLSLDHFIHRLEILSPNTEIHACMGIPQHNPFVKFSYPNNKKKTKEIPVQVLEVSFHCCFLKTLEFIQGQQRHVNY